MADMNNRNITISITVGTIIKTVLIVASLYFIYQFLNLVLVILTAVVLASVFEPATRRLCQYGISRVLAVVTIYASIIIFFSGIFYPLSKFIVARYLKIL